MQLPCQALARHAAAAQALVLLLIMVGQARGDSLIVSPECPTDQDSVTLTWLIGAAKANCEPQCEGSWSISDAPGCDAYPPFRTITFNYECVPPPRNVQCADTLVSYGPSLALGALPPGRYSVKPPGYLESLAPFEVRPGSNGYYIGGVVFPVGLSCRGIDEGGTATLSWLVADGDSAVYERIDSVSIKDGRYCLTGVTEGNYRLVIKHPDYHTYKLDLAPRSDTTHDVTLVPRGITGTVYGRVGLMVEGIPYPLHGCTARVAAAGDAGLTGDSVVMTDTTDSLGMFGPFVFPVHRWDFRLSAYVEGIAHYEYVVAFGLRQSDSSVMKFEFVGVQVGKTIPFERCTSRVLDGVEYLFCASEFTRPTGKVPDGADSVLVERNTMLARYAIVNVTDSLVTLPLDSSMPHYACNYPDPLSPCAARLWVLDRHGDTVRSSRVPLIANPPFDLSSASEGALNLFPGGALRTRPYALPMDTLAETGLPLFFCDTATLWAEMPAMGKLSRIGGLRFNYGGNVLRTHPGSEPSGPGRSPHTRLHVDGGRIVFELLTPSATTIELFGLNGRRIACPLSSEHVCAGRHVLVLPRNLAQVMLVRFTANGYAETRIAGDVWRDR
ncbi:MAG: hypothetical protein GF331_17000 [Chitinivibrionales bacterium]|nr:hypothetical protein [Chitinivibrionales bacterium]